MLRSIAALTAAAALAACTPEASTEADPPAPPESAEMEPAMAGSQPAETIDPGYCTAIADLLLDAIEAGRAEGDVAAITTIGERHRTMLREHFPDDQGAQYYASSYAVFDDLTPEQLTVEQARCEAGVDADYSAVW
jgi:hypothetical protein